jgi:dienelactone hydrolase
MASLPGRKCVPWGKISGATVALLLGPGMAWPQTNQMSRLPRTNLLVYHGRHGEVLPVKSKADWPKRRAEILRGFQQIAGPLPGREKRCPLDVRIEERNDCGSYEQRLITYSSEPGSRVPAYLLIPRAALGSRLVGTRSTASPSAQTEVWDADGTRPSRVRRDGQGSRLFPAVLCLPPTDGKFGPRVCVEKMRDYYRAYARDLAERGFVTLSPAYPQLANYQPDLKSLGWQSGTLKAVWDNVRGLDVLDSLPFVRRGKYGALGHSLGGHNAIFTAILDKRIRVVVSSCGFDSFLDYYEGKPGFWAPERGWCQTRYLPRLAEFRGRLEEIPFDFHELLGALAPRPVLVVAPLRDDNFKPDSVDEIVKAAAAVYRLYGAPENLRLEHPDCAHDFPAEARERAYRLLAETLR